MLVIKKNTCKTETDAILLFRSLTFLLLKCIAFDSHFDVYILCAKCCRCFGLFNEMMLIDGRTWNTYWDTIHFMCWISQKHLRNGYHWLLWVTTLFEMLFFFFTLANLNICWCRMRQQFKQLWIFKKKNFGIFQSNGARI